MPPPGYILDNTIQAQSADGVIHAFPAGTANDEIDRVMKLYAQLPDAPWANGLNSRREAIQTGLKAALVPPVLLLLLGSALGWAFTGFRRS
jgi:hypothetical protein